MNCFPLYVWGNELPGAGTRATMSAPVNPNLYNMGYLKGRGNKPNALNLKRQSPHMSSTEAGIVPAQATWVPPAPAKYYNADYLQSDGSQPRAINQRQWTDADRKEALDGTAADKTKPTAAPGKLTVAEVVDTMKLISQAKLTAPEEKQVRAYAVDLALLQKAEKTGLDDTQQAKLFEINSYIDGLVATRLITQRDKASFVPKDKDIEKMNKLKKALSEIVLTVATTPADKAEQARLIGDVLRRIPSAPPGGGGGGGDGGDDGGDGGDGGDGDIPVAQPIEGDFGEVPTAEPVDAYKMGETFGSWLIDFKNLFKRGDKAGIENMAKETLAEQPLTKAEEKELKREEKYAEEDNEEFEVMYAKPEEEDAASDIENENYDGRELPDVDFEPVKPKYGMTPLRENADFQFAKDKRRPLRNIPPLQKEYALQDLLELSQKKKLTKEEKKDVKVLKEIIKSRNMEDMSDDFITPFPEWQGAENVGDVGDVRLLPDEYPLVIDGVYQKPPKISQAQKGRVLDKVSKAELLRQQTEEPEQSLKVKKGESVSSKSQKGRVLDVADQLMRQGMSSRGIDRLLRRDTEYDNEVEQSELVEPEPVLSPLDLVEAAALGEYKFNSDDEEHAAFSEALVQLVKLMVTKEPISNIAMGALKNTFRKLYGKTIEQEDLPDVYEFVKQLRPNKKVATTIEMLKPIFGKKSYEELIKYAPAKGRPRKLPEEMKERPPITEEQKKYRDLAVMQQLERRTPDFLLGQGRKKKLMPRKRK